MFNFLIKGHDEKHTIQTQTKIPCILNEDEVFESKSSTRILRQYEFWSSESDDTPPKIIFEMNNINAHLMSDKMKLKIGMVKKLPIEKEEDIQDVGFVMIDWKLCY